LDKVYINTMNRLVSWVFTWNLTQDELRGAKFALYFFKWHFKTYKK
jgi:hypothetical protein